MQFRDDERLFVGREIDGKWYNRFKVIKPDRILDVLNTKEDTFISLAYNFMRKCLFEIYTEEGEPYKLRCDENVNDYYEFKFEDLHAIAWRAMKLFNGDDYAFDEYFFCDICSKNRRNPIYHKFTKSWDTLYKNGKIAINYLDKYEDCRWTLKLKKPSELNGIKFDTLHFETSNFGDAMEVSDAIRSGELQSEVEQMWAYADLALKSVDGLDNSKLLTYKRKNKVLGSFTRDFIKTDEDWFNFDELTPKIGFDPSVRFERCPSGTAKLKGMDFSNFFLFLGYKNRKSHDLKK